jgi:hypothetical protein
VLDITKRMPDRYAEESVRFAKEEVTTSDFRN